MELRQKAAGVYEHATDSHKAEAIKAKLTQALSDRDATVAAQAATIADMRDAQEGLRLQQEQLSSLLESSRDSVCPEHARSCLSAFRGLVEWMLAVKGCMQAKSKAL
jgi:DNA-binding transcriptional regulator YiaG